MFDFLDNVATLVLFAPVAANPFLPKGVRRAAVSTILSTMETNLIAQSDQIEIPDEPEEVIVTSTPKPETEVVVEETEVVDEKIEDVDMDVLSDRSEPSPRRRILDELDYTRVKKFPDQTVRKYDRWQVRGQTPPGSEVLSTHSEVRELAPEETKDLIDTVDIVFDKDENPVVETVAETLKRKRDLAYLDLLDPEEASTVLKSDTSKVWTEFFVDLSGPNQVPFYLIDNVRYAPERLYPWMLNEIYEKSRAKGLCVYATFGAHDEWKIFCRPVRIGDMDEVYLYKIESPTHDEINDLIGFDGDIWLLVGGNDIFSTEPSVVNKAVAKALKKGVKCAKGRVPLSKLTDLTIKMIRKLQDIMKTYNTVTLRGWERTACLKRRFGKFEEEKHQVKIVNEPPAPKQYRPNLKRPPHQLAQVMGEPDVLIGAQNQTIQGETLRVAGLENGIVPVSLNSLNDGILRNLINPPSRPVLTGTS